MVFWWKPFSEYSICAFYRDRDNARVLRISACLTSFDNDEAEAYLSVLASIRLIVDGRVRQESDGVENFVVWRKRLLDKNEDLKTIRVPANS